MFRFIYSNILILVGLVFFHHAPQFLFERNHLFRLLIELI